MNSSVYPKLCCPVVRAHGKFCTVRGTTSSNKRETIRPAGFQVDRDIELYGERWGCRQKFSEGMGREERLRYARIHSPCLQDSFAVQRVARVR